MLSPNRLNVKGKADKIPLLRQSPRAVRFRPPFVPAKIVQAFDRVLQ
jgi:hypothetical protein